MNISERRGIAIARRGLISIKLNVCAECDGSIITIDARKEQDSRIRGTALKYCGLLVDGNQNGKNVNAPLRVGVC